jgi:type VI secretion system secreted protein VgrG
MSLLDLSFASGENSLSVRRVQVHEGVSTLYNVTVWARSPHSDMDLTALVGQPAGLTANLDSATGGRGTRKWSGVVGFMEQVQGEAAAPGEKPLSTYYIRIVPRLWLLTQRQNHRIYQHLSIPDITDKLLGEWGLAADWQIQRASYPKIEFKVQYGETDFAFLSRLWEEVGIAFTIPDGDDGKTITLGDKLEQGPDWPGGPLPYMDNPSHSDTMRWVTNVNLSHEVRPGAYTIRDYDFRRPSFALFGEAPKAAAPEDKYEQYHYQPHGFLVEVAAGGNTPVADDQGTARHDQKSGTDRSDRALGGERTGKIQVSYETNVIDVWPGRRISIENHPHAELDVSKKFLVIEATMEASFGGEWSMGGNAVPADTAYKPAVRTAIPKLNSVQTATVVGPAGQEIHTDEFGRVRVQFPWDREGQSDEHSSCWIRVSQGWAGTGYGMIVIPRIGHEVLVGFLNGNADAPVIVGRVFNATEAVPYKLPDHKTRSTWKSNSSIGGDGFNEIMFEDDKGKELVYEQAQKNLRKLVKNDETITVGHDRQKYVMHDETETTGNNRTEVTGNDRTEITDKNRMTTIGGNRQKLVQGDETERTEGRLTRLVSKDQDHVVQANKRERVEADSHLHVQGKRNQQIDGVESLTVGQDQQEQVGNNHALKAGNQIHLQAGASLVIEAPDITFHGAGGFIRIDGSGVTIKGDLVKINSGGSAGSGAGSHPEKPDAAKEAKITPPQRPVPDNVANTGFGPDWGGEKSG